VSPRRVLLLGLAAAAFACSCAYYNTFYLARKYYDVAVGRQPYLVDRPQSPDNQNLNKSIDYSKKVLGQYSKSKWVDDAYLLWARALLGKDDPGQTIMMLQDFEARYPKSPVVLEAKFYLGVAYRQNRKYRDAARTLDEFLTRAPRHDLAPYALLERARALNSLQEYADAAAAAGLLIERWPKHRLAPMARAARAEARFKNAAYADARDDYRTLGLLATTDEDRLAFLLHEADCLEAAKAYDEEMTLLKGAQSHEPPPPTLPELVAPTPGVVQTAGPAAPTIDRYGQLAVRIATVHALQGRVAEAVTMYHGVVRDYPRTPLAAEAQYRIGYAYEITADDFERARIEYAKVRDIASSAYTTQAAVRLANLDRIAKFHSTTRDTVEAKAEAAFLLAEQYLFQVNKPERALEQYRKIEHDFAGTPWGAKAIVAQAWVLSRKLDRKAAADSMFWIAVRQHPATDAQLAARDYLEMEGAEVPADLIQMPVRPLAVADTAAPLSHAPANMAALGSGAPAATDSLGHRAPPEALVPGAALLRPPDPLTVGPPVPTPEGPPVPTPAGPPAPTPVAPPPVAQTPPPANPPAAGAGSAPGPVVSPIPGPPPVTSPAPAAHDTLRTAPPDTSAASTRPPKP